MKIKFEGNNIFPTDKDVNIPTAIIVIRAIFAKDGKYYPQLFLDDGLYKKCYRMKGSIFQMESMLMSQINQKNVCCHCQYFLDKNFSYGPYLCDGCYNMTQKCNERKNIAIIRIKKSVYRICFLFMSKRKAKKLMVNSNLTDKKGFL